MVPQGGGKKKGKKKRKEKNGKTVKKWHGILTHYQLIWHWNISIKLWHNTDHHSLPVQATHTHTHTHTHTLIVSSCGGLNSSAYQMTQLRESNSKWVASPKQMTLLKYSNSFLYTTLERLMKCLAGLHSQVVRPGPIMLHFTPIMLCSNACQIYLLCFEIHLLCSYYAQSYMANLS